MHPLQHNSSLYYSTIQMFHLLCLNPEREVILVNLVRKKNSRSKFIVLTHNNKILLRKSTSNFIH